MRTIQPESRIGEQCAEDAADGCGDHKRRNHAEAKMGDPQSGGIGAQTKKGGLGKVDLPQVTDGNIETDQQYCVDRQQGQETQNKSIAHR